MIIVTWVASIFSPQSVQSVPQEGGAHWRPLASPTQHLPTSHLTDLTKNQKQTNKETETQQCHQLANNCDTESERHIEFDWGGFWNGMTN